MEYERSVGEGEKSEEPPASPEVQLTLPREMARELRKGGYKLILEPISGQTGDEPFGFEVKAVPIDPAPEINSECASDQPTTTCTDPSPDVKCDTDNNSASDAEATASESDNVPSKAKKSGLGSAHRGGNIKKYDLWLRMSFATAVRVDALPMKNAREKFKAPARRAREWLKEYDAGEYSNLPSMYTQEELKQMYRLKGAGRKLKDAVLEEKLVAYYNQLKEELYPITSELLAYECLTHDEKFLGGSTSPLFTKRISDFLRHWRQRNLKRLRKPTSTGQKLPDGYTGK